MSCAVPLFGTNIRELFWDSSCFLFFTEVITEIHVSMEVPKYQSDPEYGLNIRRLTPIL